MYEDRPFHLPTLDEYCGIVGKILDILPEDITIHRLTGDGPKRILIAPLWSADKKKVINALRSVITVSDRQQGS